MKHSSFSKISIFSIFLISIIFSCGKDDEPNQVCCSTEIETTADFQFLRRIPGTDSIYWIEPGPFDTIYNGNSGSSKLYFKAKSSRMDSYNWKVGTDPSTFTDSLFFLTFGGINGTIDVTLTTTNNEVNTDCFPNDEGTETFTKSIEMKTYSLNTDLPIYGK